MTRPLLIQWRCVALAFCVPVLVRAQAIPRIVVRPALASLDAEFNFITSVREVADGRVIITDGRDQRLYVADFRANDAVLLGRKGKGPAEWSSVGVVHALGADSSIMTDFSNQRWMLFDGARIAKTIPPDNPAVRAARGVIWGADARGHVLLVRNPPPRPGTMEYTRADSNAIVLVDRTTGRADTIAKVRERPHRQEVAMDSLGRVIRSLPSNTEPNAQNEVATLFVDGWLAVVRLEPLRVDWRSPTGQWTKGSALPLKPEAVDARERKAIERRRDEARAEARQRGLPAPSPYAYPSTLPILSMGAMRATPDGRLVLGRTSSASNPDKRWLVINRRGGIDGEITLGPRDDIVGFGPHTLYVTTTDDDDVQHLRRHAWP